MSEPVLRIEGLTAGYGGAPVLRELDLTVGKGEVVALLGSNGAGKTTTLRAVSGLIKPMSGQILIEGRRAGSDSAHALARRGLAHVPEGRGLFFGLTVAEHFRLGYRGERLDTAQAFEYVPQLKELLNRRVGLLSGGEQQMLAVARALARGPKLLLLDEMSLGLAPVMVESLLPIIRKYADDTGVSVLLVEQHVHLALEIADRGYVLSHGSMVMEGSAETLRRDRQLLMASYLGRHAPESAN